MRIEQLQGLKKISETHSLNRAAQSLFISQQALSASIHNLEKELNTVLLNRSKTGVTLTADGEYVLTMGKQLLDAHDNIQTHFMQKSLNVPDNASALNISCIPLLRDHYLGKPISYFYKTFPRVSINLSQVSNETAIRNIQDGTLDLAFVSEFTYGGRSSLDLPEDISFFSIGTSPIMLLCSRYSHLAPYRYLSLENLLHEVFVYNNNYSTEMNHFFFSGYTNPPQTIFVQSTAIFQQMIADNNAVSFYFDSGIPVTGTSMLPEDILVKKLSENARMSIGYLYKKSTLAENTLSRIFVDHLL